MGRDSGREEGGKGVAGWGGGLGRREGWINGY